MAVLQSTYSEDPAIGYAGMVLSGATSNRITRTIEDAGGVAFGKAVFRGSGDHGCTATPSAAGLGFAIATSAAGILASADADKYVQYDNVAILTEGEIVVSAAVAVADGEPVYVTSADAITNVSSGNTILTGWVFDRTTAAAGLVPVAKR